MKKSLLIIFALFTFLLCRAEEKVFPTSDAIWVVHHYGGEKQQLVYGLSGDTIIDAKTYQKLYMLADNTLDITDADIYVGGIRQESKKVWMLPADQTDGTAFEEFLLYNFGAEVEEAINFGKKPLMGIYGGNYNFYEGTSFEDVNIDNLTNVDGYVWRKEESEYGAKLYVEISVLYGTTASYELDDIWIQGIGSQSGLFIMKKLEHTTCGGSSLFGGDLICMKEKDEIKYLKDGCTSCFEEPFIDYRSVEDEFAENKAKVSYNSTIKSIKIEAEEVNVPLYFKLFSIDGNRVATYLAIDSETEIGFDKLPKGVYIYNIAGQNLSQSGKLIIE